MFKCYFQAVWLFFPHSLLREGHSATHSHKAGGKPGLVVAHRPPPPVLLLNIQNMDHIPGFEGQLLLFHCDMVPQSLCMHGMSWLYVLEKERLKVRHDKNSKEWQHAHEVWRSHTSTYANTRTTPHKHMIEQIRNSEIWSVLYSTAHKCKQQ